jgi:hypothetical protein
MRSPFAASVLAIALSVSGGVAGAETTPKPARPEAKGKQAAPRAKRFTGSIRIRQQGGTLYYDFEVKQGKVTTGICAHQRRNGVMYDIVGGWYDGQRLMLLLQSRGTDLKDKWFAHAHQFQRSGDFFELEHTLFGYGKTMDSGIVYQTHVIDRLERRDE